MHLPRRSKCPSPELNTPSRRTVRPMKTNPSRARNAVPPALTVMRRAGDVLRLFIEKERDSSGNVPDLSRAPQRTGPHDPRAVLARESLGRIGVDKLGRESVDAIPDGLTSLARERVNPIRAAVDALYTDSPLHPMNQTIDALFKIRPAPHSTLEAERYVAGTNQSPALPSAPAPRGCSSCLCVPWLSTIRCGSTSAGVWALIFARHRRNS